MSKGRNRNTPRRHAVAATPTAQATIAPPGGQATPDPAAQGPTEEEKALTEEKKKIYASHRDELGKRQLSNAENLDKSILTYSSAGLALSLGFLKNISQPPTLEASSVLYWSWVLFVAAIISTIISYPVGQAVIDYQLDRAKRYYLVEDDDALYETSLLEKIPDWLGTLAALCFVVAVGMTTYFVYENVRSPQMANNTPRDTGLTVHADSATGMSMQPAATGKKGGAGMQMQAAANPASTSGQQPAASTTSGSGKPKP